VGFTKRYRDFGRKPYRGFGRVNIGTSGARITVKSLHRQQIADA
jgi:hypothetical protein